MTHTQQLMYLTIGVLFFAAFLHSAIQKRRARRERDFMRSLETLLQPKETVRIICPQKGSRWILTSHRLIFERRGNFHAVPLKSIKRIQGSTKDKKTTTVVSKMTSLTVKAEKDYLIRNTGPEFAQLASEITAVIRKQNEKKKGK